MSVHRRRRRDGTTFWVVRWRAGGRDTKQSSRSFDRKRDADQFESERRRHRQLGQLPTSEAIPQTLESFAQEWWPLYTEPQLAPKTLLVYHDLWRLHVRAQLGGVRLGQLTPALVERFQANMRATGVGDATIRNTLALLEGVLKRAVLSGRISTNPVEKRAVLSGRISTNPVAHLSKLSLAEDTCGDTLYDLDPTNPRPAADEIRDARAAGVPTVFPTLTSPPDDKRPESPHLQEKHEALSGTRTLDPLLTIRVRSRTRVHV